MSHPDQAQEDLNHAPEDDRTSVLALDDLHVEIVSRSGTVHAVRGLSLAISAGEAVALVGESGSGKTMTLRAAIGLLPAGARVASGTIAVAGQQVDLTRGKRAWEGLRGTAVAMVFQEPSTALNPVMRIGNQIGEAVPRSHGSSAGARTARVLDLIALVGLPDPRRIARRYPHELSGGQRQRVVIAMALAGQPAVLLCDEPTTALDVTVQDQILDLLDRLRAGLGLALLYVSHDLAVVSQLCERVAVMYAGQIIEAGPTRSVLTTPHHPYTAGLLDAIPDITRPDRVLRGIPGSPPDLTGAAVGCPFAKRCTYRDDACSQTPTPLVTSGVGRATACLRHTSFVIADQARR